MTAEVVLVTGGTRGLGLALCGALREAGYRVIAAGRKSTPQLAAMIAEPRTGEAGSIAFEPLDLAESGTIHTRVTEIVRDHGPLFGLVNNAAIARDGVLATMHETEIHEVVQVNVTGTIILTKYAIRPMLARGRGRVVNISSIIASTGFNGLSVYAASKAALIGFTRSLAREVGKAGVTVNAVLPGYMQTDMSAGLDAAKLQSITRRSPMGQLVSVDDVSRAIRFLLSGEAARITGTTLTVDAGSTC